MQTTFSHTIHKNNRHHAWNHSLKPALIVDPGDVVTFEVPEATGGQFTPRSKAGAFWTLDFSRVNPLTGPVWVDGAAPGDAIKITLLAFELTNWGWTAILPGFGLLADVFPDPALHIWRFAPKIGALAEFKPGGRVPIRPFPGTIGLAPGAKGAHDVMVPRRVGGNMDTRDITEGTILHLPVEVAGGLLSIGDGHAAQGDGEVCGTALESPFKLTLKLELKKGAAPQFPWFSTPGPVSRHIDEKGYDVTTGVGSNLMASARAAVLAMIDLISNRHQITGPQAYMLCSVCADLRITEIVNSPNRVVACYFPRSVFDG